MGITKQALIRYSNLDKCFSNFNRLYTYDDLLDEINKVLIENGTNGIQLRQLKYDVSYMESEQGWSIELDNTLKVGRKKALRYLDRKFSIANHQLNINDKEQLDTTLEILSRYKHREEFNWLEELIPRIQQSFNLLEKEDNGILSYQQNFDLKGKDLIGQLFNLILKRKQIKIVYHPFKKNAIEVTINPHHLKQYNNRWFLFCTNPEYNSISNYPLDRIDNIEETKHSFKHPDINWLDYFDDMIGVSKKNDIAEKIKLKFSEDRINYVLTKPIHGTQKLDSSDNTGLTITIEVIPNNELFQLLMSFGPDLEVISPNSIRDKMKERIEKLKNIY